MEALWFALASVMVAIYVVMDGFDFGAGALHLFIAKEDRDRRKILGAIGPFWDGNEVWLLAGGGVLFLAFPKVLASGLSGFYLAIMLVLWVLILRGISIEFRSHIKDGMWRAFWDGTFWISSLLAPILFGAALGNLLRGVPLNDQGYFSLPLWASFTPTGELGILDWYTVIAGVMALVALMHHGALFLAWRTDGEVETKARAWASKLFPVMIVVWIVTSIATHIVNPAIFPTMVTRPLALLSCAVFLVGLVLSFTGRKSGKDALAFIGSGLYLLGILAAAAATIYPTMIFNRPNPEASLTALNSAASEQSLRLGLLWWPVGLVIAIVYTVVLFRIHAGKVEVIEGEGY
ncbi:MAG: cytochrome d ubiquinol oxidase subunit II [Armatimonadetes bacterium]|nr:cytochrome d ubiquinol oxidase subunit II [Armatimonadota bacterium]